MNRTTVLMVSFATLIISSCGANSSDRLQISNESDSVVRDLEINYGGRVLNFDIIRSRENIILYIEPIGDGGLSFSYYIDGLRYEHQNRSYFVELNYVRCEVIIDATQAQSECRF